MALRCRAEADYFRSGCVLGFDPIRINISTSLHRSHFGSRPNLEMQPDDRSHVSCSSRFSPTEAAFACMSLARARRRLIHEPSLNASQRRVGDSLTLQGSASDKARHRDILSNRYHCNYQPYNCEWWVIRSHEYIVELYSSELWGNRRTAVLPTLWLTTHASAFSLHGSYMHYPFTACCRHLIRRHYRSIAERQLVGSWFIRLEIYLHTLSWFFDVNESPATPAVSP